MSVLQGFSPHRYWEAGITREILFLQKDLNYDLVVFDKLMFDMIKFIKFCVKAFNRNN